MPMLLYYQVMRRTYIWCLWALNNISDIFHTELYLAYYNTYFFIVPQYIHRCSLQAYISPFHSASVDTQVFSKGIPLTFGFNSSKYTGIWCIYTFYLLFCSSRYTDVQCKYKSHFSILLQQIQRCTMKVYVLPSSSTPIDTQVYTCSVGLRYTSYLFVLLQQIHRQTSTQKTHSDP